MNSCAHNKTPKCQTLQTTHTCDHTYNEIVMVTRGRVNVQLKVAVVLSIWQDISMFWHLRAVGGPGNRMKVWIHRWGQNAERRYDNQGTSSFICLVLGTITTKAKTFQYPIRQHTKYHNKKLAFLVPLPFFSYTCKFDVQKSTGDMTV